MNCLIIMIFKSLISILILVEYLQQIPIYPTTVGCTFIKHNYNRNLNLNRPKIGFKKRNENLCPTEYESCWCDKTNTNNNNEFLMNSHNGITYNTNTNHHHHEHHKNTDNSQFSKENLKIATSSTLSIMIDCQFYNFDSNMNSLNRTKNKNNKTILTEIPRINTAGSTNKFKYLSHITHLDLSRTDIREVPTDAFQVSH